MPDPTPITPAELAADLVNTSPLVWPLEGDRLAGVEELAAFLAAHGVPPGRLDAGDLRRAHSVRDRLRTAFDAPDDERAVDALNALLGELGAVRQLARDPGGAWAFTLVTAGRSPVDRLAAVAADGLLELLAADGRRRLGHCAAEGCNGVFVDTTRNRSRRFCIPELCGNRTNLAAYRARRRPPTR